MAVLDLRGIICDKTQEAVDEPYLVVNGVRVWGPASMRTRSTQVIRGEEPVYFSGGGNVIVELWEHDLARSELIGGPLQIDERFTRIFAENPRRDCRHIFHGDRGIPGDATYTLTYRVSRVQAPPGPDSDATR